MADLKAYWDNLRRPMPLGTKLKTIATNQLRRFSTRAGCCGHPGEPGC